LLPYKSTFLPICVRFSDVLVELGGGTVAFAKALAVAAVSNLNSPLHHIALSLPPSRGSSFQLFSAYVLVYTVFPLLSLPSCVHSRPLALSSQGRPGLKSLAVTLLK
jgi:hypothetical protein